MGTMNLLKANWEGRVGQTVGAKWKDKSTIRTYTKPSNPNTPAQQQRRDFFGYISRFFAQFAGQMKPYNTLDTRSMSYRNALFVLNKERIQEMETDLTTYYISKGSYPIPSGVTIGAGSSRTQIDITLTPPATGVLPATARLIAVVAESDEGSMPLPATVATFTATSPSISIPLNPAPPANTEVAIFLYYFSSISGVRKGGPSYIHYFST